MQRSSAHVIETEHGNFTLKMHVVHRLAVAHSLVFGSISLMLSIDPVVPGT
jgi:hypothetical protein